MEVELDRNTLRDSGRLDREAIVPAARNRHRLGVDRDPHLGALYNVETLGPRRFEIDLAFVIDEEILARQRHAEHLIGLYAVDTAQFALSEAAPPPFVAATLDGEAVDAVATERTKRLVTAAEIDLLVEAHRGGAAILQFDQDVLVGRIVIRDLQRIFTVDVTIVGAIGFAVDEKAETARTARFIVFFFGTHVKLPHAVRATTECRGRQEVDRWGPRTRK